MSKVFELIEAEKNRQSNTVELIASENFVSENVLRAVGSCFTNKYAEGYPGHRYYGGCKHCDELETYCQDKWKEAFQTHYHVNVQPHSGTQANMAVYSALLKPGDYVLSMKLENGGHLSHFAPISMSGKLYNGVFYGLDKHGYIDYSDLREKILTYKPKLILAGASAYSREIDFGKIYHIIERCKYQMVDYDPFYMADIAHIAGLVVAGEHQSPFGFADVITTTTHKTLRGTRGGLIFCRQHLAKKIDSAVFPGNQGGPLMHVIAGKAVAAEEACTKEFGIYINKVVSNTKAMCNELKNLGYEIVSGGTDNHLFMIDFSRTHPTITGQMVQDELERHGITLNKNCVPGDKRGPNETSGVRIGCAAMTTRGYNAEKFRAIARLIHVYISGMEGAENGGFSKTT